jgi:hypothetical protein
MALLPVTIDRGTVLINFQEQTFKSWNLGTKEINKTPLCVAVIVSGKNRPR